MSLTNQQYDSILRTYEAKQLRNQHILVTRTQEVHTKIPDYADLAHKTASISLAQGRKLLEGDSNALNTLKDELKSLSLQKQNLLQTHGFPSDYLQPIFDCSLCKDTGYHNGRKCNCFQNAFITMLYQQSNIQKMLEKENFSSLSYSFYEGEDLDRFSKCVDTCKDFAKNFKEDYQNLFFYGTVGTGKSFLSGCIAKELMDTGYSVIYFSASKLFETLSKYSFDYKSKDELHEVYQDIYNCHLLIIDDLGTELTNQFVTSQLFSCINERHLRRKSTIISTNLSLKELSEAYSERIFSRITNYYKICKLSGSDIRMQLKRSSNRK